MNPSLDGQGQCTHLHQGAGAGPGHARPGAAANVEPDAEDLHARFETVETPLNQLDTAALCPGSSVLDKINASLR